MVTGVQTCALPISIFDGALAIRALEASGLGSTDPQVHFEADIAPISMSHLSSAFGWPKLFGQFSGHIPRVDYRNKVVSVTGDVEARVFDGRIIGSKIRLQDPLGPWPRFFADVLAEDLDLELVTRAFEFGTITGRLGGRLGNLELFNWSPVAFDAALQTPDGDRSKHRISARAIGNLANIGGGGGGVINALQSGTLKFFDAYSYDRIGIGCGLRNDVCRMSGVEVAADGRYFILKGKGLPHINIIGSANRVNWPRLLSQITAQMSGSGTVRIE